MEMGIKSKEARKYIFNCLDDMMQVDGSVSPKYLIYYFNVAQYFYYYITKCKITLPVHDCVCLTC